jgi:hypothetical protein
MKKLCSSFFCWIFNNQIAKSHFKKFDCMFMVWELSYLCNIQVHHWTKVAQGLEQDWSWMAICLTCLFYIQHNGSLTNEKCSWTLLRSSTHFYRWVEFYIFDRAFWTFVPIHSFRNIHLNNFDTLVGYCQSLKQTSNFRWNQSIDFSSSVCCTAKCRCCQCYLSLTVKKSHRWSNLFSSMKSPFCLWWGLTGYRPTGSETRNDGRSSSENKARLRNESSCDTSSRFAFPSITGNKMSFPSFPLQNFRGALSLSLSLRSRACAALWLLEAFFFCVQF